MKNFLYLFLLGVILCLPFFRPKKKEVSLSPFKKELLITTMIEEHNIDITKLERPQEKNRVLYTTYIASPNDTLWSISRKFGINLSTIISTNNLTTNVVKPGMSLKIPNQKGIVYKVKKGESLWKIAKVFNISLNKIKEVNEISTNIIREGEKIFLPGANLTKEIAARGNSFIKPFIKPIVGQITSNFGYRFHPILERYHFHTGIDIKAPYGSSIKAASSGRVIFTGWKTGYGKCVIIKHDNTYKTLYGHLSKIFVKEGQFVEKRECVGQAGASGLTTGSNLHFEILKNNKPINPKTLL